MALNNYGYMGSIELGPAAGPLGKYFAQGARCGAIEGKGRAGQYVIGEETELSWEAADANTAGKDRVFNCAWSAGYRYGYLRAAEGSTVHPDVYTTELPPTAGA
jgi:hypothetical protein